LRVRCHLVLVALVGTLMSSAGLASAQIAVPAPRGTTSACPADAVAPAPFTDVPGSSPHASSVDCVVHWQVARGRTATTYAPAATVSREQMAGFVHRALVSAEARLPQPVSDRFRDDDGSTFEREIDVLAEAGVVRGRSATSFHPAGVVTRAELASLVHRAVDLRLQQAGVRPGLPEPVAGYFTDVAGGTHAPSINTVAAAGVVAGYPDGSYRPTAPVTREQMATFLARTLDLLVVEGTTTVPPPPGVQPDCTQALAVLGTAPTSFRTFADAVDGPVGVGSPWRPGRSVVLRGISAASGDPLRQAFDAGTGLRGEVELDEEALQPDQPRRVLVTARADGALSCSP
jgi:hypothetical protein